MESYKGFALVYDIFMQNTPYEKWVDYIEKIWKKYNLKIVDVLDLGCGTGNVSISLYKRGYSVIGIDLSENMLSIAREKAEKEKADILFLNQDMREFELYGTVESIVCLCDTINYILEESELLQVFKLVYNYLHPGGIFIFDINTKYKFENILAENNFCQSRETGAYIWENYYDNKTSINEYYTDFYIKMGNGFYERFEETHFQKAYELKIIEDLLRASGLKILEINNEYEFNNVSRDSERVSFAVLKEN